MKGYVAHSKRNSIFKATTKESLNFAFSNHNCAMLGFSPDSLGKVFVLMKIYL